MQWEKFYKKWAADVGSFIAQDVAPMWQAFVQDAEEAVMIKAIEEIAVWYNAKNQRSDSYVANITLYQLREAYMKFYREAHPEQLGNCQTCEGVGHVFVSDNGKYNDPDYPPEPGKAKAICAFPCPTCRSDRYPVKDLRDRIFRRCRPDSRRHELYGEVVQS